MNEYPLAFRFEDSVPLAESKAGSLTWAFINLSGRALMAKVGDQWWMLGVSPSGIAESGGSPGEAHARFLAALMAYFIETAGRGGGYEAFRDEVERFAAECDPVEGARWHALAGAIRSGELIPEAPFSGLKRVPHESGIPPVTVSCGVAIAGREPAHGLRAVAA